jgi:SAM domain (Sterile alpha motif)
MHQIADWLEKLGMSEYAQRFAENDIDSSILPYLTDQDLKELGISLGHRRKMLAVIGELAGAAPATPKPDAAIETKTQGNTERRSGFLKHNGDRVRSTVSETGGGGDASLAIGRRSISGALDQNFLQVADEAIDELRHAVELDSHQAPPLAEGGAWPGAEEVIEEDQRREPVSPPSFLSTPVPEQHWSTPRPRIWIGIMMRFAGAAAGAAIIAAFVVWKTSWNMNNGHFDQGPPVASGLSRSVESDDGDRSIIASRRPAPAAPKLAVGEESAPSRDTLAGAATSQQREPSAKAPEATPSTPQARPPDFVTRQLERDEVVLLVKRGADFIASGDLSSARLVLQRAAEAGDMHAALALAGTFDPNLLAQSFSADVVMARFWYERAKQLGSSEAPRRLEQLESSGQIGPMN